MLDQQWEFIQKKENAREIYSKLFQMNLRNVTFSIIKGVERERSCKHDFIFRCDLLMGLKMIAREINTMKTRVPKTKRNVLFLGLELKIFFFSRDHLNFKSRSNECQSVWSSSGCFTMFPFFPQRRERQPIVCLRQQKWGKKKSLVFKLSEDTDNSGEKKTEMNKDYFVIKKDFKTQ